MADIWMDVDAALSEVPINKVALIDDTDFKTREESVVYNQSGLDLVFNFVTTAGAFTQTAVTPTDTAGDYDWVNKLNGMYVIEIPASAGASINNDTEGFGWFTGFATGILPWTGPTIGFRAAGINNKLIDVAYDTERGLAGTALPGAVADAAGGLAISDAGGLDIDATDANVTLALADTAELQGDWVDGGRLDLLLDAIPTTAMRGTDSAATAASLATAQLDLDTITGSDGVTLATAQALYAPSTAASLSTAQTDLDTLTGSDGATLATTQGNYAPSKAGDAMTLSSGAITAAVIATDAIGAAEIAAGGANLIADHVLRRTQANVEASSDGDTLSGRCAYGAAAKLVNKTSISGTTLTVTKSDDSTALFTQALTTNASADPVTASDTV